MKTYVPEPFLSAYIDAALWSSTYGENGEFPMDDGKHKLSDSAKKQMEAECADFLDYCEQSGINPFPDYANPEFNDMELSGHDFWLTRNGHGAGYWERDLGEIGRKLTAVAKTFGRADLYIGDDGEIYQS